MQWQPIHERVTVVVSDASCYTLRSVMADLGFRPGNPGYATQIAGAATLQLLILCTFGLRRLCKVRITPSLLFLKRFVCDLTSHVRKNTTAPRCAVWRSIE